MSDTLTAAVARLRSYCGLSTTWATDVRTVLSALEAAQADAARYRWLFPNDSNESVLTRVQRTYRKWDGQSDWTAAIDAAMKGEGDA